MNTDNPNPKDRFLGDVNEIVYLYMNEEMTDDEAVRRIREQLARLDGEKKIEQGAPGTK